MCSSRLLKFSLTFEGAGFLSFSNITETCCKMLLALLLILMVLLILTMFRSGNFLEGPSALASLGSCLYNSFWYSCSDSMTLSKGSSRILFILNSSWNSSLESTSLLDSAPRLFSILWMALSLVAWAVRFSFNCSLNAKNLL